MPMSWIVAGAYSTTCLLVGHLVVFRQRCTQDKLLIDGIQLYLPALQVQSLQIVIYPAFSVLFDRVSTLYQVLLTFLFSLVKKFMKKALRKYTRELHDFSTVIAVTGVEICASLYQSMILQSSPSASALAAIMGFDVVQGLVAVKFFMDRPSSVAQHLIVSDALQDLSGSRQAETQLPSSPLHQASKAQVPLRQPIPAATDKTATSRVPQALQLVSVAESILLMEYVEVVIPLLNAVFVLDSCQFSATQNNTRLRQLYLHPDALATAVHSIALYSAPRALSFLAMQVVMRRRYGLSAVYHLAFILERHWQSIVGKMVAWLQIILHFTAIHFGVDFSFRFDFAAMLDEGDSS